MKLPNSIIKPINQKVMHLAHEQMLASLAKNSTKSHLGAFSAAVILSAIGLQYEAHGAIVILLILVMAAQLFRNRVDTQLLSNAVSDSLAHRLRRCALASFLSSVSLAFYLVILLEAPVVIRSVYTLILLSLATGAVSYRNGHPMTYRLYMLPLVLPLSLVWALNIGEHEVDRWLSVLIGGVVLLYGLILWGFAANTWQAYVENLALRLSDQERAAQLSTALAEAAAANLAKTKFLAIASHDLRQPLHTISLLTSILKLRHAEDSNAEVVNMLSSVVVSLGRQLDDLLDISKLDSGVLQVQCEWLDLGDFLRGLASEFEPALVAKNLKMNCHVSGHLYAYFDQALLARVIRNLMHNALKFTNEGSVSLVLSLNQDKAVIKILDTGRGIAAEHQNDIFNEFFQIDNAAHTRAEGLGLGLAIVKRLCNLMNIQMHMTSALGRGTQFDLILNAKPEPIFAPASTSIPESPRTPLPEIATPSYNLRVLVVDDEAEVCASMSLLLEELGCDARIASTITQALEVCSKWVPDVVIADYRLADHETGIQTVERVRRLHPQVTAILISGDTASEELLAFEAAGLPTLHKPVSFDRLIEELGRAQASLNTSLSKD
ncbi:MAG: hybrid sensor histidine kinase/response regulator [Cytophagales bacterium]|nr:hybrid sensor histidine kinase/response regulator [Cytophagales bacterium]